VKIGLISDTHGRLRSEVFDIFEGVDRILHAGDIGPYDLLVELEALAPVTAVYGNTDHFDVRDRVNEVARLELGGRRVAVIHGHQLGSPTPESLQGKLPGSDIIVFGHTHRPLVHRGNGSVVINPGSAGAPRFGLEPSVAILTFPGDRPHVELIDLT
jgi:putative phosphoesterase